MGRGTCELRTRIPHANRPPWSCRPTASTTETRGGGNPRVHWGGFATNSSSSAHGVGHRCAPPRRPTQLSMLNRGKSRSDLGSGCGSGCEQREARSEKAWVGLRTLPRGTRGIDGKTNTQHHRHHQRLCAPLARARLGGGVGKGARRWSLRG